MGRLRRKPPGRPSLPTPAEPGGHPLRGNMAARTWPQGFGFARRGVTGWESARRQAPVGVVVSCRACQAGPYAVTLEMGTH
jgi:hypothetical protein